MILSFALSAISFFALVIAFRMLFAKQSKPLLNVLLFFWCFFRFFKGLYSYIELTGFTLDIPFILQFATPISYAEPVCGFLLLKSLIDYRNKLNPIDYLHFIPVVLSIIEICIWNFLSPINWNQIARELVQTQDMVLVFDIGFMPSSFHLWFKNLIFSFYLILTWDALLRSELMKIKGWDNPKKVFLSFCLTKMSLFHLIAIINLLSLNNVLFTAPHLFNSQNLVIFFVVVSFGFLFFIINHPKLIYVYSIFGKELKVKSFKPKEFSKKNPIEINSSPSERDSLLMLESIMRKEKFFFLPKHDLIILSLAQASTLSAYKCSRLINITSNLSIPDWVNKFRVEYFIQSFSEKCNVKTIDAIALESGFISKTTFYRAFKKEMGMLPTDYFVKTN